MIRYFAAGAVACLVSFAVWLHCHMEEQKAACAVKGGILITTQNDWLCVQQGTFL